MFRATVLLGMTWTIMTSNAFADDRYYMVLFGSQDGANRARMAHSFATFVKVPSPDASDDSVEATPEVHTISWLPANGKITLLRLAAQKGRNFSLEETLRYARSINAAVTAWGPFEVKKELYEMAQKQIARLNSGQIGFLAIDALARGNGATNCVHAISDLDATQPMLATGTAYGNAATRMLVQHLSKWCLDADMPATDVIKLLKLEDANIHWVAK